jgi:D-glycero-D-manno-heptose 1,7-bisphosphate phosphatase
LNASYRRLHAGARRGALDRAIQSAADVPVRPAVFLDRDGTLIDDPGYLDALDQIRLYPWTADALRLLRRAGFALVVITNQSGVARGLFPETFVGEVHAALDAELARGGAAIDAWLFCPHHMSGDDERYRLACDCRKPKPGLAHRAAAALDLDLARSVVVGDRWSDVGLARAIGAAAVMVETGAGARQARRPVAGLAPDVLLPSLAEAASWILRERR